MLEESYGHTPIKKVFEQGDVYGVGRDEAQASRKKLNLAIIGAGGVAQSKYWPAIHRLQTIWEPVEIVAFAEPNEVQARKVQQISGGRWFADLEQMLAEDHDFIGAPLQAARHSSLLLEEEAPVRGALATLMPRRFSTCPRISSPPQSMQEMLVHTEMWCRPQGFVSNIE